MKTTKYGKFYNSLVNYLELLNTDTIKSRVGNSVNNNRVPSVNQVITFLTTSTSKTHSRVLGKNLASAYSHPAVRTAIKNLRKSGTNRTDAFDINEFRVAYLMTISFGGKSIRQSISHSLR